MNKLPKSLKYCMFLIVLGLITGGLLSFINSITNKIIADAQDKKIVEDLESEFPGYVLKKAIADFNDVPPRINQIYYGQKNSITEIIIYQVTTIGYSSGDIITLIGIDVNASEFIKVKVIAANNQTKGIGTLIFDHDFKISGKDIVDYQADIISGATISSNAVVNALDIASTHFRENKDNIR